MCDDWVNNPKSFFDWAMANGYKEGLSIDRIDNDGDYCPENCRWTDAKTQANNTSRNIRYKYGDKEMTVSEWADYLGITYSAAKTRIKRGNFDELFNTKNGNYKMVTHNGITKSIKEWAIALNLNYSTVRDRVRKGTFERLFPNTWAPGVYGWKEV